MFSSSHYINTLSLFFIAFVNSFYILSLDNNLRLPAFIFFAGYLIVFPGLSLLNYDLPVKIKKLVFLIPIAAAVILLVILFSRFHAEGYVPALSFIFFIGFLLLESGRNREFIIRSLMLLASPVMLTEIILNGKIISAGLLFVIIIFLLNESGSRKRPGFPFYFYAVLTGAILITHSQLLIVYFFFLFFAFRNNLVRLLITGLITAAGFLLITYNMSGGNIAEYLDFYFKPSLLFDMPMWLMGALFIIALYIAWITAELYEVYFASALFILIPAVVILIINIVSFGIEGLRNNNYFPDFMISVPLFLAAIKDHKVDPFRGRLMEAEPPAEND